jgi:uncharacterized protein (TIGR03437 family)
VAIQGVRTPLFSTSSGQIELQVPWDIPIGDATVVVSVNGTMSSSFDSTMQAATPSIIAVTHADSSPITVASPAAAGEEIVIYMTGLGAVDPEPILGTPAPALPLANTTNSLQVTLGSVLLTVIFSGLTPGTVGVYQANVILPQPLGQTGSPSLSVSSVGQTASIQLPGQ